MNLSRRFDQVLLALIAGYQRFLSPRKGWRCAYCVLHGGPGCSGFARDAIQLHGGWAAFPSVRQRFRDCKGAAQTLRAARKHALITPPRAGAPRPQQRPACLPDLDCLCCAIDAIECAPDLLGACDCLGCF